MSAQLVGVVMWAGLSVMGTAPQGNSGEPAWAQVSEERRKAAMQLFEQANQEVLDALIPQAVEHYLQALGHWDHPGIHYNLAVALLSLANPLESHGHLEAAIRHGPDPLGAPEKYERAQNLLASVQRELARLEVTCDEPQARVSVDDRKDVLVCPGAHQEWLRPGEHRVVIEKAGFKYPTPKTVVLAKGKREALQLKLYPDEMWVRTQNRWPLWMPLTVMGGGLAVIGGGGLLHLEAGKAFDAYDRDITECAGQQVQTGFAACSPEESAARAGARARGELLQGVAIGGYVAGGLIALTGGVLLYVNLPRPIVVNPETGVQVAAAPWVGRGSGGVALTFGF